MNRYSWDMGKRMTVGAARRGEIVEMARQDGFVSIEALAERYHVTPQTIRRDINELCEQGVLERLHGGARLPSSTENLAYLERQVLFSDEKQRIAKLVAEHVPHQASLFINIGTTNEAIAEALLNHRGLSIITNNLNVASILAINPDFRVIIAGGQVRHHDRGIVGEATLDLISQFKVDIGIIGISAIEEDGALLDFDYREVRVAQAILENSRKVYLAADHSKFGRSAMARLGSIEQVDAFFTDRTLPHAIADKLAGANIDIHVADR